ncbi:hypothetical protein OIU79_008641 [Salix purpurea]|uniref:Uncharacterized protein n=1 Tax=Salix purpurea TaxID=77065 RepID=A0A9Q0YWA6_SALPP|nr:hypothetical protein OIU79_008641 [Salix purpurea]
MDSSHGKGPPILGGKRSPAPGKSVPAAVGMPMRTLPLPLILRRSFLEPKSPLGYLGIEGYLGLGDKSP